MGDFDGDGYGDMIVTARYGGYLLRGCAPAPLPAAWGVLRCSPCQFRQIATGDFDGDGRTDVAFADGDGIEIFSGNPVAVTGLTFPGTTGATVLDFNYDGYSDLVRAGDEVPGTMVGHEGGATGLSPVPSTAPQPQPFTLVGDFDGDGYWDLIGPTCHSDARPAATLVGYGGPAGWGAPFIRTSPLDRCLGGVSAAVVDLDADGYDDLLLGGPGEAAISYYAGAPGGLSTTPSKVIAH
jgi:hypothetical protein